MSEIEAKRKGRLQFLLLAALFLGPLVGAWYYYGSGARPDEGVNRGQLVEAGMVLPEALGEIPLRGKWTLLMVEGPGCDAACADRLYRARQVWLSLGRKAERVQRVVLSSPGSLLDPEQREVHPDLLIAPAAALDTGLAMRIAGYWTGGAELVVVDPLGNLVLLFPRDYPMADLKADLTRLLRVSRIG